MFIPDKTKVSYFRPPITSTTPRTSLTIPQVWGFIVGNGRNNNLKELTETLRGIQDPDERKKYKGENLPFVLFGGEFTQRNIKGLTAPSNLLILDFDHLGNDSQVEEFKNRLSQDKTLDPVLLFRSPSGDGLKVVVNIRQEIKGDSDFKACFRSLDSYIRQTYKTEIDPSGKDISRACFLAYDPQAILQEAGSGFDVEKWKPAEAPRPEVRPQVQERTRTTSTRAGDEVPDYVRALIAVEDIERSGIDITGSRDQWMRIGFALATLGEAGRELFHRVSVNYPRYNREETDKQFDSYLRGEGSGINLESLFAIAKEHGVSLRSSSVYSQKPVKTAGKQTNQGKPSSSPVEAPRGDGNGHQEETQEEDRSFLLRPTSEEEMFERESRLPEGLMTGYSIGEGDEAQSIILGGGVLTGIVAPTNHGKTIFLLNLLMNVSRLNPDKRFVLFTYEENGDRIRTYLLNTYLEDLDLNRPQSNRRLLKRYFRTRGRTDDFNPAQVDEFRRRKNLFFRQYIDTGRVLIQYIDSDSNRLVQDIEFLSRQGNIGGVFVDYFQCINPPTGVRFPTRQEALKSICFQLKDVANQTGLPVVLACQFNQEVLCPLDVLINKVGEAGDISRIMSEMFGLWNLEKEVARNTSTGEDQRLEPIQAKGEEIHFQRPDEVGLYVKTLKSRELRTGTDVVLRLRGNNGKIYPNDPSLVSRLLPDWSTQNERNQAQRLSFEASGEVIPTDPNLALGPDDDLPM